MGDADARVSLESQAQGVGGALDAVAPAVEDVGVEHRVVRTPYSRHSGPDSDIPCLFEDSGADVRMRAFRATSSTGRSTVPSSREERLAQLSLANLIGAAAPQ